MSEQINDKSSIINSIIKQIYTKFVEISQDKKFSFWYTLNLNLQDEFQEIGITKHPDSDFSPIFLVDLRIRISSVYCRNNLAGNTATFGIEFIADSSKTFFKIVELQGNSPEYRPDVNEDIEYTISSELSELLSQQGEAYWVVLNSHRNIGDLRQKLLNPLDN